MKLEIWEAADHGNLDLHKALGTDHGKRKNFNFEVRENYFTDG